MGKISFQIIYDMSARKSNILIKNDFLKQSRV